MLDAVRNSNGRSFQLLVTRLLKKNLRMSSFDFSGTSRPPVAPRVFMSCRSVIHSKNSCCSISVKPFRILKHSVTSARSRLCSSDVKLQIVSLSSNHRFLSQFRIQVLWHVIGLFLNVQCHSITTDSILGRLIP